MLGGRQAPRQTEREKHWIAKPALDNQVVAFREKGRFFCIFPVDVVVRNDVLAGDLLMLIFIQRSVASIAWKGRKLFYTESGERCWRSGGERVATRSVELCCELPRGGFVEWQVSVADF